MTRLMIRVVRSEQHRSRIGRCVQVDTLSTRPEGAGHCVASVNVESGDDAAIISVDVDADAVGDAIEVVTGSTAACDAISPI